jgi:hypothetical protein
MPIDHTNRIFFIHIPKTAGSSIEKLFNMQRPNDNNISKKKYRLFGNIKGKNLCYHHMPLEYLIKNNLISYNLLDTYFVFTFVRNPYTRIISEYYHRKQPTENINSFVLNKIYKNYKNETLEGLYFNHLIPQWKFIYHNGINYCDFIGKFENLYDDIKKLKKRCNIPVSNTLPHEKKGDYEKNVHYFDKVSREIINFVYNKDFEYFNYNKE